MCRQCVFWMGAVQQPQDQSQYDPKRDREKDRGEVRPLEAAFKDFFKKKKGGEEQRAWKHSEFRGKCNPQAKNAWNDVLEPRKQSTISHWTHHADSLTRRFDKQAWDRLQHLFSEPFTPTYLGTHWLSYWLSVIFNIVLQVGESCFIAFLSFELFLSFKSEERQKLAYQCCVQCCCKEAAQISIISTVSQRATKISFTDSVSGQIWNVASVTLSVPWLCQNSELARKLFL